MKKGNQKEIRSEIREMLDQTKNELHQQQQLFIAQKAYSDALENSPPAGDQSVEAEKARKTVQEAKTTLENLVKILGHGPEQAS